MEARVIGAIETYPLIIGHRGAAGLAPENTQAAFAAAVEVGVDAVEFDVQFTADGWPVVFHDETLERMAGVGARIRDYPESVLQGFDIGFRQGPEFRGEKIPSVRDVAALIPPAIEIHAEVKDYDPVSESHLRHLLEAFEKRGGLARVIFSSPHEETISEIMRLHPGARTSLLLFRGVKVPTDAARRAAFLGCVAVSPDASLVTQELVDVCHRHHMNLFAFTINERGVMRKLTQMGVNGFFTDYPDRLRGALQ
ncbi:MAG TPA: glycerophosphodiester phosphodiesterase family protein [Candidatus Polarisedimenticolia bacterium]|jgi:glycerophosphoryl diester phosphodiesterase